MKTSYLFGRVFVNQDLLGYIRYNTTFNIADRQVVNELKELSTFPASNRCKCKKNPTLTNVIVVLDSKSTEKENNPVIHWESELCLQCMCLVGNRMPFDYRAKKTVFIKEDGTHNKEKEYTANLINKYTLPVWSS